MEYTDDMPDVIDAESSKGGGQIDSFQQLVLQQEARVLRLGSVEFTGGWWLKVIKKDIVVQRYIEDTRSAFINGVQSLYDMLEFKIVEDNKKYKLIENMNAWKKELKDFEDKFSKGSDDKYKDENEKNIIKEKYLNQKADLFRGLFRLLCGLVGRKFAGEAEGQA